MAFNGTEGGSISLDKGSNWTKNWRDNHPEASKGVFVGKNTLNLLINQEGSMGIRFYFAIDDDDKETLVMVSAGEDENDDLDIVIDLGHICPPICGNSNALNSDQ